MTLQRFWSSLLSSSASSFLKVVLPTALTATRFSSSHLPFPVKTSAQLPTLTFRLLHTSPPNMSGYSEQYITEKLQTALSPSFLQVVDVSDGCGAKFEVVIVSPSFEGKTMLQRHRMVNDCLAEELKSIHAF